MACTTTVNTGYKWVPCGTWVPGDGYEYCNLHMKQMQERYPQGWRYYPGDVCPHGKYTGGCGVDLMCGYCEME
jgi:hypothetical protein